MKAQFLTNNAQDLIVVGDYFYQVDNQLWGDFNSPEPNFENWAGGDLLEYPLENYGDLIAERDGDGPVTILDHEEWVKRMGYWCRDISFETLPITQERANALIEEYGTESFYRMNTGMFVGSIALEGADTGSHEDQSSQFEEEGDLIDALTERGEFQIYLVGV